MKLINNTILVTGGGSGIGREFARRLHDLGNTVIVSGRRLQTLQETIEGRVRMSAIVANMTVPDEIEELAKRVIAEHPDLNVLVNNAGIMRSETLASARDVRDARETIETNLLGPICLINALIGQLCAGQNAVIINVSSGLAFVPLAAAPTYSATKAALHSYTVSLRHQLAGTVEVIELAPPGVQTELTPGQKQNSAHLPLEAFMDEVMALLAKHPTPEEILVRKVGFLRNAERDSRFDEALLAVNLR